MYLVLVDRVRLPLVIESLVETARLDQLPDVDVSQGHRSFALEELCVGRLSSARSASDNDHRRFPDHGLQRREICGYVSNVFLSSDVFRTLRYKDRFSSPDRLV